jgi:hypothetical protein
MAIFSVFLSREKSLFKVGGQKHGLRFADRSEYKDEVCENNAQSGDILGQFSRRLRFKRGIRMSTIQSNQGISRRSAIGRLVGTALACFVVGRTSVDLSPVGSKFDLEAFREAWGIPNDIPIHIDRDGLFRPERFEGEPGIKTATLAW